MADMEHDSATPDGHLRQLAAALDCFTEQEHLLLSGWSEETARDKRKRGEGPPYVLHGKNYFYPRTEYQKYLQQKVRTRRPAGAAKELL
jgi:hypothetical protein